MRSLLFKHGILAGAAFALAGCLVSEEPILTAKNGKATPLAAGDYNMCPLSDEADADDCENFAVTVDDTGLYRFQHSDDADDAATMRFRRVARGSYAVQADEDDGYMYYFGRGDSDRFMLTMMMCSSLAEKTRDRLIARGDLSTEDDGFQICSVDTPKALKAAALDYHHGRALNGDEDIVLAFTPAPTP